ncbi:Endochitinase 1 [Dinochytrium kinnereticum]|nr:Endochitinase 1 [Dinochytrium kinnereticum]
MDRASAPTSTESSSQPTGLQLMRQAASDGVCTAGLENQFICYGPSTLRRCLASGPVDFACPPATFCCLKDGVPGCRHGADCGIPSVPSNPEPNPLPAPLPSPNDPPVEAPVPASPADPPSAPVTESPYPPPPPTQVAPEQPNVPTPTPTYQSPQSTVPSVPPRYGYCDGASPVRIGYVASWAQYREGGCSFNPAKIDAKKWNYLFYAFAQIDAVTSALVFPEEESPYLAQVAESTVPMVLSVGGWGHHLNFAPVAADPRRQQVFSDSLLALMARYGFVGIDIVSVSDWEFPTEEEKQNFGTWLAQLRGALGPERIIAVSVPLTPTVFQYPIDAIAAYADFTNLMGYDENGDWSPVSGPNSGNTAIGNTISGILETGFPSRKLILGMALYGRSFRLTTEPAATQPTLPTTPTQPTLPAELTVGANNQAATNPACPGLGYGCPFLKGAAVQGQCSRSPGLLFMNEIYTLAGRHGIMRDGATGTSWILTPANDLVTFDTIEDFRVKDAMAAEKCLGGAFMWSLDQDPDQMSIPW